MVEECRDGWLYGRQKNRFFPGDAVEVLAPGQRPVPLQVEALQDEEGSPLESAPHPQMKFRMKTEQVFPAGAMIRKERIGKEKA